MRNNEKDIGSSIQEDNKDGAKKQDESIKKRTARGGKRETVR